MIDLVQERGRLDDEIIPIRGDALARPAALPYVDLLPEGAALSGEAADRLRDMRSRIVAQGRISVCVLDRDVPRDQEAEAPAQGVQSGIRFDRSEQGTQGLHDLLEFAMLRAKSRQKVSNGIVGRLVHSRPSLENVSKTWANPCASQRR